MQQQQTNNNETDNNLQTREQRKIRSKTTRKKPFTSHMGTLLQLVSTNTSGSSLLLSTESRHDLYFGPIGRQYGANAS
jgi:hypothetical protein